MLPHTRFGGIVRQRVALAGTLMVFAALLVSVACGSESADTAARGEGGGAVTAQSSGLFAPEERFDASATDNATKAMPPAGTPAPAATGPGGGGDSLPAIDVLGRTIIRTGAMSLQVESVAESFDRVRQVAEAAGGFVADSQFTGSDESQRATITVRVPADQFGAVVEQLRGLAAKVQSLSTSAQDVTEEYADLQATLRNLRAVEAQYLELLGRANSIGDVLQVQDRLDNVRLQIERTQGRIQLLDHLASLATLQVSLLPVPLPAEVEAPQPTGLGATARDAWDASLETLTALATVVVAAGVFSWWLIPLAIPVYFVARRLWRARELASRVDTQGGAA